MSANPSTRPASERRIEFPKHNRSPFTGLLTNRLLSSLPGPELTALLPYLEPVSFRTGEFICEQGQEMIYIYFPETAVISQLCYLDDGSSTGVAIIGTDGLLGLSSILQNRHAQHWATATIGGSALRIRTDEVRREFTKGGPVQRSILNYANARLQQVSQRAVCNSRHRLDERLCSWLLMIQDRTNGSHLPLTHEAISQHLGTRRAGVTNFCNVLRDNGVIAYHRALITILDRNALQASACECYRKVS
ncbi:MAG TPA: Crp/Fnr family transcriptional regulator [Pyrinomonadaceae bacterium]|nr:Crp/Fnr family transcriptional regulator [Pyrinomonadaceae bacterium]